MRELEEKISAWRKQVERTLPGDHETICELEEHLRDDVQARCRAGMSLDGAFADAVKQLGGPQVLAREFALARSRWLPATSGVLATLGIVLVAIAVMAGFLTSAYQGGRISLLLFAHVVIVTAGYYSVAGTGALGAWALVTSLWRPLSPIERREVRASIFWLTVASNLLVPAGVVLGMFWAKDNLGRAWGWDIKEIGAVLVLVSIWLLLLVQKGKWVSEPVKWLLALAGGIGAVLLLGAWVVKTDVPAWLCVVLISVQIAVAMFGRSERREELAQ